MFYFMDMKKVYEQYFELPSSQKPCKLEMGLGNVIHILGANQGDGMKIGNIFFGVVSKEATIKDLKEYLSTMVRTGDVTMENGKYMLTDNARVYSKRFVEESIESFLNS